MHEQIDKAVRAINAFMLYLGCFLLFVLLIACTLQVATRYIPGFRIIGMEEVARYSFIWATYCGIITVTERAMHPSISILHDALKGKARQILDIVIDIAVLVFAYVMIRYGITIIKQQSNFISVSYELNMGIVYAANFVGGVGIAVNVLNKNIMKFAKRGRAV